MAERRFNNALNSNPYVGINVDFFDRKALQKQQRHDEARSNYSRFVQGVADDSYLDQGARDEYLKQQQATFDEVLTKHSGNLSAGFHDVLGAIETSKSSPYHNLNKRQTEQSKIQQKLVTQYGADAIDLSNVNQPLYKTNSEGAVEWSDPSQIQANVVKADDYGAIVEKMLKDTQGHKFTTQTGLGGGSGNSFYLMSKVTKGEILTPQELQQIASDPSVQQAFLANATTAGVDNRNVPGTKMTYQEMLNSPQGLANFIYGNIQDKQRRDIHETKQFKRNIGAVEALRSRNKKSEIKYEQNLKKQYIRDLTHTGPVGVTKLKGDRLNNINTRVADGKQAITEYNSDLVDLNNKFNATLGTTNVNMNDYTNKDGSFNRALAQNWMDINNQQGNVDELELLFRDRNETLDQRNRTNKQVNQLEGLTTRANDKIGNEFFNSMSKEDKDVLAKEGITSYEDLFKIQQEGEHTVSLLGKEVPFGLRNPANPENWKGKIPYSNLAISKVADFTNFRNDELEEGVDINLLSKGVFNDDPNSMPFQMNQNLQSIVDKQGVKGFMGGLSDLTGGNLLANDVDLAEFLEKHPDLTSKDMRFIMPEDPYGTGLSSHIVLHAKNEDGSIETYEVMDAGIDNSNDIANEYADRRVKNGLDTHAFNPSFGDKDMETRYHYKGSINYGKQSTDLLNQLETDVAGADRYLPFTLNDGTPSRTYFKKLNNGYVGIVGGNEQNKKFYSDINSMYNQSMVDMGIMLYSIGNPNFKINNTFYSPKLNYGTSVKSNISTTRTRDNVTPIQ